MSILLVGPPGCGKGTQSEYMVREHQVLHVSTGDILRIQASEESELGRRVQGIMSAGALVDDETMIEIIKKVIELSGSKRILFDGFPRTPPQAAALTTLLQNVGKPVELVLHMCVDREVLKDRVAGRYSCVSCGAIYNAHVKPLNDDTQCDVCGETEFKQRADDTIEALEKRLDLYDAQSTQVVTFYQKAGVPVVEIDATQPINEVSRQIDLKINNLRRA